MKLLSAIALGAMACLAVPLAGCTTLLPTVTNPINQSQVYNLENAYGVAQSAAVAYTALQRCPAGAHASATNVCSEHGIIVTLATDDQKARLALTALESFARNPNNYPGLSYGQLLQTAQLAVSTLSQIEATNGIH